MESSASATAPVRDSQSMRTCASSTVSVSATSCSVVSSARTAPVTTPGAGERLASPLAARQSLMSVVNRLRPGGGGGAGGLSRSPRLPAVTPLRRQQHRCEDDAQQPAPATNSDACDQPVVSVSSSAQQQPGRSASPVPRAGGDDNHALSSCSLSPLAHSAASTASATMSAVSKLSKIRLKRNHALQSDGRTRSVLKRRSPSSENSRGVTAASTAGAGCSPSMRAQRSPVVSPVEEGIFGSVNTRFGAPEVARPSTVRHRDRDRLDGGKVCFSSHIEWLEPNDDASSDSVSSLLTSGVPAEPLSAAAATVAPSVSTLTASDADAAYQTESMRKLEAENEALRRAIENYRERERLRSPRSGSLDVSAGVTGAETGPGTSAAPGARDESQANIVQQQQQQQQQQQPASQQVQEQEDDAEEDEVEKAVEVSPDGTFLKFDEEIGRGSFKTVYKGLDTTNGVFVAWCELQLSGNRLSKKERERFREEADLMKGLTHPNIVRFYDYWEVDRPKRRCIVLVTELMTSGTLRTYLKNFGQKKVSLKIIKSWCRQILRGLQFLHSRNPPIIHRDLKCDNIFISGTTGQVKVGDLGLATLKNRSFAKSVIGTPEFMAPEVYEEHYDEAVDVYAFGMCMLEMVTSEYPYSECTGPAQIYKKVITGVKPSSLEKVEDQEIRQLIEWLTTLNRRDRPTVKELLNQEFFAEDCGMRVDIANRDETIAADRNVVKLRLRVLDPKKRRDKHKENEAIEFVYMLDKDNPDEITKQMMKGGILSEEDVRLVAKMIGSQVQSLLRAREEKRRDMSGTAPPAAPAAASTPGTGTITAGTTTSTNSTVPVTQPQPPPAAPSVPSVSVAAAAVAAATTTTTAISSTLVASSTTGVTASAAAAVAASAPVTTTTTASVGNTAAATAVEPVVASAGAHEKLQVPVPAVSSPGDGPTTGLAALGSASSTTLQSDASLENMPSEGESAAGGEKKERKKQTKRRRTCDPLPRLTVLEVKTGANGPIMSCLLETNQAKDITFQFDLREADVCAIADKMMEAHLLPVDDAQFFRDLLQKIVNNKLLDEAADSGGEPLSADSASAPHTVVQDVTSVNGLGLSGPDSMFGPSLVVSNSDRPTVDFSDNQPITFDYCGSRTGGGRSRFVVSSVTQTDQVTLPAPTACATTGEEVATTVPATVTSVASSEMVPSSAVAIAGDLEKMSSSSPAVSSLPVSVVLTPVSSSHITSSSGQQQPQVDASDPPLMSLTDTISPPSVPSPSSSSVDTISSCSDLPSLASASNQVQQVSVSGAAATAVSGTAAAATSAPCTAVSCSGGVFTAAVSGTPAAAASISADVQNESLPVALPTVAVPVAALATATHTVISVRSPIAHTSLPNGVVHPPLASASVTIGGSAEEASEVCPAAVVTVSAGNDDSPDQTLSPQATEHSTSKLDDLRKQLTRLTCFGGVSGGVAEPGGGDLSSQSATPVSLMCSSTDLTEVKQRLATISGSIELIQVAGCPTPAVCPSRAESSDHAGQLGQPVAVPVIIGHEVSTAAVSTASVPSSALQISGCESGKSATGSSESTAGTGGSDRRKGPPPLLLSDLEKELSKLHRNCSLSSVGSVSGTGTDGTAPVGGSTFSVSLDDGSVACSPTSFHPPVTPITATVPSMLVGDGCSEQDVASQLNRANSELLLGGRSAGPAAAASTQATTPAPPPNPAAALPLLVGSAPSLSAPANQKRFGRFSVSTLQPSQAAVAASSQADSSVEPVSASAAGAHLILSAPAAAAGPQNADCWETPAAVVTAAASAQSSAEFTEFVGTHPKFLEMVARHRAERVNLMNQQDQETAQMRRALVQLWNSGQGLYKTS